MKEKARVLFQSKTTSRICSFFVPIINLGVWYFFVKISFDYIHIDGMHIDLFLILSFLIFIFLTITKSTYWSIGHEKFGIQGDSRARLINFHNGDLWFDLFADNTKVLSDEGNKTIIKELAFGRECPEQSRSHI